MRYECETCGEHFEDRYDCEKHEKKCGVKMMDGVFAELVSISQTHYENPRDFRILKKTVPITEELVNKFKVLETKESVIEIDESGDLYEMLEALDSDFSTHLGEYILHECEVEEKNIDYIIKENEYDYYTEKGLIYELGFKDKYCSDTSEVGMAYISIFRMDSKKLKKHDNVNIELEKWITDNRDN